MHSPFIEYFNDCYRADNREQSLWDIYATQNEFLQVHNTQTLTLLHREQQLAIEPHYGEPLHSAITTYRREKTLLYGHHFLTGLLPVSQGLGGRAKRLCAPLVMFQASLEWHGPHLQLQLDSTSAQWNTPLLAQLIDDKDALLALETLFDTGDFHNPANIAAVLQTHNERALDINIVDNLTSPQELESIKRKATAKGISIVAGGALLLAKRSQTSRGIIDELNMLADAESVSTPLATLLHQPSTARFRTTPCQLDNIPGLLSDAQKKALHNGAEKDLSLLIGPPGTGKSYTIACMVLERFMKGESVLVVSQNEYAVDVIQQKLIEQLGLSAAAIIRAGTKDYHRYLKQYIDNITKGIGLEKPGPSLKRELAALRRTIHKAEKQFLTLSASAVSDGIYLDKVKHTDQQFNLVRRFKLWRQRNRLQKHGLLYELLTAIQQHQAKRESTLSTHINNTYLSALHTVLNRHRQELMQFNSAIRARTSATQETRFAEINYSTLLKALPIWLCSLASLHRTLPLKKELFDLVIIDEATQCDIASCLPALQRAKRAVIVGDPKQLRHISFLSGKKQAILAQKNALSDSSIELNYRDNSMIDYADQSITSQQDIVMLDEHYRSLPGIINFSNRMFYGGKLRIMTEKPLLNPETCIELIPVENATRKNGINQREIDAIIAKLTTLVAEQKKMPAEYKLSIGVISFFRDQAEKLQKTLAKTFDVDTIAAHKLRAGTPYTFQGEERDIILLSCGVDIKASRGTYQYLNKGDVFNVAITRARDLQFVFLSTVLEHMPSNNLLTQFIDEISQSQQQHTTYNLAHEARDANIVSLCDALHEQGMKVLRNYPIAGIPMDLVAMYESHSIAIDIIGFPGESEDVLHLERYKIFERAGLTIFPLSYTAWVYERQQVLDNIKAAFSALSSMSISKLSIEQMSTAWAKLLPISPELAKTVRTLEFDLIDNKQSQGLSQLTSLIERFCTLHWVLNQRLNANELTYSRYYNSTEAVFSGVINNLRQIIVLTKVRTDTQLPNTQAAVAAQQATMIEQQQTSITELFNHNTEALLAFEKMALQWSQIDTNENQSDTSLSGALTELDRLRQRVEHYHTDNH